MKIYNKALKTFEHYEDIRMQAVVLNQQVVSLMYIGEHGAAKTKIKETKELLEGHDFPAENAERLTVKGHFETKAENFKDYTAAQDSLSSARELYENRVHNPQQEAVVLFLLAELAETRKDLKGAKSLLEEARKICMGGKCKNENRGISLKLSVLYESEDVERAKEFLYRAATLDEESGMVMDANKNLSKARSLIDSIGCMC